ncbi:hypothetical protein ACFLY5_00885, partial [Patescibacteria group bacterium]
MNNEIKESSRMADKWPEEKSDDNKEDEVVIKTNNAVLEKKEEPALLEDKPKSTKWEGTTRGVVLLMLFLLPVWFLPFKGGFLGMSKSVFIFAFVLLAVVFYLVHILQEGVFKLIKSYAFLPLFFLLITVLASTFMSKSISFSLFGNGGETGTFAFIFVSTILLFLVAHHFQTQKSVIMALSV